MIVGGSGDDQILGGNSHDILIGGIGADRIVGNGGDDILIAGTVGVSSDPIDMLDELLGTLDEWSTFRSRSLTGSRLVVGDDTDVDTLTGSAGDDWYFYNFSQDKATDRKKEFGIDIA